MAPNTGCQAPVFTAAAVEARTTRRGRITSSWPSRRRPSIASSSMAAAAAAARAVSQLTVVSAGLTSREMRMVVEAGHRDVVGHAQTEVGAGHVGAVGEGVGEREEGGRRRVARRSAATAAASPVGGGEPAHPRVHSAAPVRPVHPRREHRDALVAEAAQVVEHELGALVGLEPDGARRRGQRRADRDDGQLGDDLAPRGRAGRDRQRDQAVHALVDQAAGAFDLGAGVAVGVGEQHVPARAGAGAAAAPRRTPGASSRPGCRRSRRSPRTSRCAARARSGRSETRAGRPHRGRARPSPPTRAGRAGRRRRLRARGRSGRRRRAASCACVSALLRAQSW